MGWRLEEKKSDHKAEERKNEKNGNKERVHGNEERMICVWKQKMHWETECRGCAYL